MSRMGIESKLSCWIYKELFEEMSRNGEGADVGGLCAAHSFTEQRRLQHPLQ